MDDPAGATAKPSLVSGSIAAARQALQEQLLDRQKWLALRRLLKRSAAEALREMADDPDTHIAAGLRALERGDNGIAANCFYRAFELAPTHMGVLHGLAEALVADGQYSRAVPIYEMIVDMAPDDHVSGFNLGVILTRLGRYHYAERIYKSLVSADQRNVRAGYNLATLYQAQGRLSEAREAWQAVIAAGGDLPSAHTALGQVNLDLGDAHAAMLAYAEAAKARPDDADAWVNLAAASRLAGSWGRAMVAARRALAVLPEDAGLWKQLGEIQLDLHRQTDKPQLLSEAVASWQKSLQLDPDQPQLRDWLKTYKAGPATGTTQPAG